MSNPNCPVHVGVRMRRFVVTKNNTGKRVARAAVMQRFFRCSVEGCPRVETDRTFYIGKTWAGDVLNDAS